MIFTHQSQFTGHGWCYSACETLITQPPVASSGMKSKKNTHAFIHCISSFIHSFVQQTLHHKLRHGILKIFFFHFVGIDSLLKDMNRSDFSYIRMDNKALFTIKAQKTKQTHLFSHVTCTLEGRTTKVLSTPWSLLTANCSKDQRNNIDVVRT